MARYKVISSFVTSGGIHAEEGSIIELHPNEAPGLLFQKRVEPYEEPPPPKPAPLRASSAAVENVETSEPPVTKR